MQGARLMQSCHSGIRGRDWNWNWKWFDGLVDIQSKFAFLKYGENDIVVSF
jgi:hypothetical protein